MSIRVRLPGMDDEGQPPAAADPGAVAADATSDDVGLVGPGPFTPDGSPVEAFALLPPPDCVPALLSRLADLGDGESLATVLDLGCGAGRLAHELLFAGHPVTGVDQSPDMLERVLPGVKRVEADIETLDLGEQFDAVILASFLINTPEVDQRAALIATCARHLAPDGALFVQRLDPELVPEAVDASSEEDGVVYAMTGVRHDEGTFEATISFTIAGETWASPFRAEVLTDVALADLLRPFGLAISAPLGDTRDWLEIHRS